MAENGTNQGPELPESSDAPASRSTTAAAGTPPGATVPDPTGDLMARAMRACGFPPRGSDSPGRLRHLARDLVLSAWCPGPGGVLDDDIRQALEAAAVAGATPREARLALARAAGRRIQWRPGRPTLAADRERTCLLLAALARVDRHEYERHGVQVPGESSLAELRRWITQEGVDRKVSALLREAEVGSPRAEDDFCNRLEGLLRGVEERLAAAPLAGPPTPPVAAPRPAPAAAEVRTPAPSVQAPAAEASPIDSSFRQPSGGDPGRPPGEGEGGAKPRAPMRPEDVALIYLGRAVREGRPIPSRTECALAAGVTKQATMKWELFSSAWRNARKTEKKSIRRGYRDARTGDVEAQADDDS